VVDFLLPGLLDPQTTESAQSEQAQIQNEDNSTGGEDLPREVIWVRQDERSHSPRTRSREGNFNPPRGSQFRPAERSSSPCDDDRRALAGKFPPPKTACRKNVDIDMCEGIKCNLVKTKSVNDCPIPSDVTEVRRFLVLASYYSTFIPGFSEKAAPLTDLTKRGRQFKWEEGCQRAFEQLKRDLTSVSAFADPNMEGDFVLNTDTSGFAMGGLLSQIQDGEEKVVECTSRTLNPSRQRYCVTYREIYAVVFFVKHFRHYLMGRKFLVRTDRSSLRWLTNFETPEGMVARWKATLDEYDFTIDYRKGSLFENYDASSRKPYRVCECDDCVECIPKRVPVRVLTSQQSK